MYISLPTPYLKENCSDCGQRAAQGIVIRARVKEFPQDAQNRNS